MLEIIVTTITGLTVFINALLSIRILFRCTYKSSNYFAPLNYLFLWALILILITSTFFIKCEILIQSCHLFQLILSWLILSYITWILIEFLCFFIWLLHGKVISYSSVLITLFFLIGYLTPIPIIFLDIISNFQNSNKLEIDSGQINESECSRSLCNIGGMFTTPVLTQLATTTQVSIIFTFFFLFMSFVNFMKNMPDVRDRVIKFFIYSFLRTILTVSSVVSLYFIIHQNDKIILELKMKKNFLIVIPIFFLIMDLVITPFLIIFLSKPFKSYKRLEYFSNIFTIEWYDRFKDQGQENAYLISEQIKKNLYFKKKARQKYLTKKNKIVQYSCKKNNGEQNYLKNTLNLDIKTKKTCFSNTLLPRPKIPDNAEILNRVNSNIPLLYPDNMPGFNNTKKADCDKLLKKNNTTNTNYVLPVNENTAKLTINSNKPSFTVSLDKAYEKAFTTHYNSHNNYK